MRIAYFDCFSGAAGNMLLGALLDAGLEARDLEAGLRRLDLGDWEMRVTPVTRRTIGGLYVEFLVQGETADHPTTVPRAHPHEHHHEEHPRHGHGHHHEEHHPGHGHRHHEKHRHGGHGHRHHPEEHPGHGHHHCDPEPHHGHGHRHEHHHGRGEEHEGHAHPGGPGSLASILQRIQGSGLPAPVVEGSCRAFRRLAEAEGRVHRTPAEEVHFHEVGAVDAILDVVGTVLGLHLLGVEEVYCSPLPQGHGFVRAAHGKLPLPAPATACLLHQVPVRFVDVPGELVTPTGAALLASLARFAAPPTFRPSRVGYGAGRSRYEHPNLVRLFVGETEEAAPPDASPHLHAPGDAVVCEANLDDMNPQLLGPLLERLLAEGALDVAFAPLQMKKNRPGVQVQVLCPPELAARMADLLLAETTTLGVRWHPVRRRVLERREATVETPYGPIRVKVAGAGATLHRTPEYEDCRRAAEERGAPVRLVYEAALRSALDLE